MTQNPIKQIELGSIDTLLLLNTNRYKDKELILLKRLPVYNSNGKKTINNQTQREKKKFQIFLTIYIKGIKVNS